MGHQELEALETDFPLAEHRMPVDAGAELFHGVVDVKSVEVIEADDPIEFFQGFFPALFGADVVAGDENVAGVDADADPDFFMNRLDDRGDLLKSVADARSLPRGHFEEEAGLPTLREIFEFEEAFNNRFDALLDGSTGGSAGMKIEVRDFEEMAPLKFFAKSVSAFFERLCDGRSKVDQVAVVAHDLGNACLIEGFFPESDLFIPDFAAVPLFLVAGEELDGGRADVAPLVKGILGPARSRGMGAD